MNKKINRPSKIPSTNGYDHGEGSKVGGVMNNYPYVEYNKYEPTENEIKQWLEEFERYAWEHKPKRINPNSDLIVFDSKMVQSMWVGYFAGRKAGLRDLIDSNERID